MMSLDVHVCRVPHIIVHGSELTAQLSMLKKCFDIDVDNDADEGQVIGCLSFQICHGVALCPILRERGIF